jgi:tagatose-6-phosphate ketose/aldose isomerase
MKELYTREQGYTAREVSNQPGLWKETYASVVSERERLAAFLGDIYQTAGIQIILTGAGSSAFIGDILQYAFHRNTGLPVKAVATTDLVTHPATFFLSSRPVLLVSFARSGDSPESVAALELAEKLSDTVHHLVITCNPHGRLAVAVGHTRHSYVFLLPSGANDQALAMTSSFTCMALAGLLISDIGGILQQEEQVRRLSEMGSLMLDKYAAELDVVADLDFKRIVFLGSGPLKGVARESQLKVIELTDGRVNCQYDSFLGFRHGPRAIIDESTLLVYIFSNDPYVRKYELDLVKAINGTERFLYSIGIGQSSGAGGDLDLNLAIEPGTDAEMLSDDLLSICYVIPAQVLGFYKSLKSGLDPDAPSKHGGIHRVVQGVTIYPYQD